MKTKIIQCILSVACFLNCVNCIYIKPAFCSLHMQK